MSGNNSEVAALSSSKEAQGLTFMTTQKMAFWLKLIVHFISNSGNRKCCLETTYNPICQQSISFMFLHLPPYWGWQWAHSCLLLLVSFSILLLWNLSGFASSNMLVLKTSTVSCNSRSQKAEQVVTWDLYINQSYFVQCFWQGKTWLS